MKAYICVTTDKVADRIAVLIPYPELTLFHEFSWYYPLRRLDLHLAGIYFSFAFNNCGGSGRTFDKLMIFAV